MIRIDNNQIHQQYNGHHCQKHMDTALNIKNTSDSTANVIVG